MVFFSRPPTRLPPSTFSLFSNVKSLLWLVSPRDNFFKVGDETMIHLFKKYKLNAQYVPRMLTYLLFYLE